MSRDFKIEHENGCYTVGIKINADNGSFWKVTFYRNNRQDATLSMTDAELVKLLTKYGFDSRYIQRIIGTK